MSLLSTFASTAKSKAAAFGLSTAMAFSSVVPALFSNAANGQEAEAQPVSYTQLEPSCAPLMIDASGFEAEAGASAHSYSKNNLGSVGISIYPGTDLGDQSPHKLGTALQSVMDKYGISASCFVQDDVTAAGTSVQFHIAGLSWKKDGYLTVSQSLSQDTLAGVIAEARTAKALLAENGVNDLALNN